MIGGSGPGITPASAGVNRSRACDDLHPFSPGTRTPATGSCKAAVRRRTHAGSGRRRSGPACSASPRSRSTTWRSRWMSTTVVSSRRSQLFRNHCSKLIVQVFLQETVARTKERDLLAPTDIHQKWITVSGISAQTRLGYRSQARWRCPSVFSPVPRGVDKSFSLTSPINIRSISLSSVCRFGPSTRKRMQSRFDRPVASTHLATRSPVAGRAATLLAVANASRLAKCMETGLVQSHQHLLDAFDCVRVPRQRLFAHGLGP